MRENYIEQSEEQLVARAEVLRETSRDKHSPEVAEQIKHEMGCIAFELWQRYEENSTPEIAST